MCQKGFAHGFLSLEENSTVIYITDREFSSEHDSGICWDSIDFDWGKSNFIISEKDRNLPKLQDFQSPFLINK